METNLVIDWGTFRQLAALMAMQGLLANGAYNVNSEEASCAKCAVRFADALLEAMTLDEHK